MTLQNYFKTMRVVAGVTIFVTGFLYAHYNPGILSLINGAGVGLVIYALWRT